MSVTSPPPIASPPPITIGREACVDLASSLDHEWLVTNGLGGFASGTIAGALTRRYHGLLFAALRPPLGRTLLVAKLDETLRVGQLAFPLATNIWTTGVERPAGCELLTCFTWNNQAPLWRYAAAGAALTKRVWMEHNRNATFVRYALESDSQPVQLSIRALMNHRDYHALAAVHEDPPEVVASGATLTVRCAPDAAVTVLRCAAASPLGWEIDQTWYRRFYLPVEAERGYGCLEDHLSAGVLTVTLQPGESLTVVAATEPDADVELDGAWDRQARRAAERLTLLNTAQPESPTPLVMQLALAADQFIVRRTTPDAGVGHTIIAGYPWFSDWGRDTMIALPGLTLHTGRSEIAREILLTWAQYVSGGMIPNRFPDDTLSPEYHTADAALWYIWAIDEYLRYTHDDDTLVALLPTAREIVDHHTLGTRHHIRCDDDGLLTCGGRDLNLTWMDAKIGHRSVTPRAGKPIEVNALWIHALTCLTRWLRAVDKSAAADEIDIQRQRARESFARFWNSDADGCFDVLDGPDGNDPRLRPNQVIAAALPNTPLSHAQRKVIVDLARHRLLTPYGPRSLAPGDPDYHGVYAGDVVRRDEAYHNGTAWPWLLGSFVIAHYRVYDDIDVARSFLDPFAQHLRQAGVGSISEVFDGDSPHPPRGAIAQAWSVAELLRAQAWLSGRTSAPDP